jgi:hypothetical protein
MTLEIRTRPAPAPSADPAAVSREWVAPIAAYDDAGRIVVARRTVGEVVDALIGRDPYAVPVTLARSTGIPHGPERRCEVCPDPAYHVGGRRCAAHAFAPRLSREPLPLRSGDACPRCGIFAPCERHAEPE